MSDGIPMPRDGKGAPRSKRAPLSSLWLLAPAAVLFLFAFILPVGEVALWSVQGEAGLSAEHYEAALGAGPYRTILFGTLQLSFGVAFACILVGYPAAYFLASCPPRNRTLLLLLILTPLWVSVLVRTFGWIVVLGREGLVNSLLMSAGVIDGPLQMLYTRGAVYIAMVQVLLPVAILVMFSTMVTINRSLLMASRILGASPWRGFVHIFLPLSAGGAINAWMLTFVLALGFFITPALVGGPKETMIANLIATQITLTLDWGLGSALGVVLLIAGFAMVGGVALLFRRVTTLSGHGGSR
ncbi:ABC transporter permease (plasmid) [Azospirillum brasilense]|uniref:ABC transporter permease n=1 Tax=Azospirillum brasilense TaxID=192 RepID=A0A4D8QTR5_AZOBR|nr:MULTISPECIES: ABC transporter permease [Azospirillum]MDW7554630.1 ABC transporter permease [Azospirillum brasilense]MDW7593852.1 ABC transporter permease [Azospirillum brasilense]MDW7632584.1 ABC transporter permease [Azospirillum brasilense]MDX5950178.1 ABC transporter permease [Azospirillum brasilense]NUB12380.1 ABC transporter permease subunit [Azospirillum brasilense]